MVESREAEQMLGIDKKPITLKPSTSSPDHDLNALPPAPGGDSRPVTPSKRRSINKSRQKDSYTDENPESAFSPASGDGSRAGTPSKRRSTRKSRQRDSYEGSRSRRGSKRDGSLSPRDPKALKGILEMRKEASTNKFDDDRWSSRLWRFLIKMAGLSRPLGQAEFKYYAAKHNDDASKILTDIGNHMNHTDVVHRDEFIFDFYLLAKDSSLSFIVIIVLVYFLVISLVFGIVMNSLGCLGENIGSFNLFGAGFMIVSGMVDLEYSLNDTACVYIDAIAVLVGLYVSLPVFSAVIIVRLLANNHKHLRMSPQLLLTKRNGLPCAQLRIINQSGTVLTNLRINVEVWISRGKDIETGENYFDLIPVEFNHPFTVGGTPFTVTHTVNEESVLKRKGLFTSMIAPVHRA